MTQAFDAWLRGRRAEARLSRAGLSEILGVSAWTIGQWENGEAVPIKVADVATLASWGEVSMMDLVELVLRDSAA